MKKLFITSVLLLVVCLILTFMTSGNAIAVGPGKTLEFKGSSMGTVLFDGSAHEKCWFDLF